MGKECGLHGSEDNIE